MTNIKNLKEQLKLITCELESQTINDIGEETVLSVLFDLSEDLEAADIDNNPLLELLEDDKFINGSNDIVAVLNMIASNIGSLNETIVSNDETDSYFLKEYEVYQRGAQASDDVIIPF